MRTVHVPAAKCYLYVVEKVTKRNRSRTDTYGCHRKNLMNVQVAVYCFIKEFFQFEQEHSSLLFFFLS